MENEKRLIDEKDIYALFEDNGMARLHVGDIDVLPRVDAQPVVHGHWEITQDGAAYCTACKRKMNLSQYGYAFCSLCGAHMDRMPLPQPLALKGE